VVASAGVEPIVQLAPPAPSTLTAFVQGMNPPAEMEPTVPLGPGPSTLAPLLPLLRQLTRELHVASSCYH
jgi:hypothetical protein